MDWKIVSLEIGLAGEQISEVFNHVWPLAFSKRNLEYYGTIHPNAISELIKGELQDIDGKILTVYSYGGLHHYTYGLYKLAENKFGKCCYWHFDNHTDWGFKDFEQLDCGAFVYHLTRDSLSKCTRSVGSDARFLGPVRCSNPLSFNYKGFNYENKEKLEKHIKKLIKKSNENAYLSFDLDVMDKNEITTAYSRGSLTSSKLIKIIDTIQIKREIISADILGYYINTKKDLDAKSLVLYLVVAGKLLGEDIKEFTKLHTYLKKKDDVRDMKTLLKCLG